MGFKKTAVFILVSTFSMVAYADPIPTTITRWLKSYQTQSVTLHGGMLSIKMDRQKVTQPMYETVVIDGVCMSLIDSPKSWGSTNIKQIEVVNKFGVQGYIFKGGAKECNAIGKLNSEQISRDFLPGRTKMK